MEEMFSELRAQVLREEARTEPANARVVRGAATSARGLAPLRFPGRWWR